MAHTTTLTRALKKWMENPENSIDELIAFTGTAPKTVSGWVSEGHLPLGENLLRLEHFLKLAGADIRKVEEPLLEELGQIISFRLLQVDEVRAALGYVETQSVLRLLFGKNEASPARLEKIKTLVETYRETLKDSITEARFVRNPETTKVTIQKIETEVLASDEEQRAILEGFRGLIKASVPLAKIVLSDRFTSVQRAEFRKSFEGNGLHGFSDLMSGLLSEKSRDIVMSKKS